MTIAVSIDGALVAPEAATISIFDRGFLYGDGLFEVLRTVRGKPLWLADHLARLGASARELELAVPGELAAWVVEAIAAAGAGDHRVRIVITRGPGPVGARLASLSGGRTIVVVEPLPPLKTSVTVAVVDWPLPRRSVNGHKTLAYLDQVIARELAAAAGADEAIRLDADGNVAECATANVFAVIAGEVVTPPLAGILPGVTRAHVLAACGELGIAVRERTLALRELRAADEAFATSALRGLVPITQIDGVSSSIGPVTQRVASAYARAMSLI